MSEGILGGRLKPSKELFEAAAAAAWAPTPGLYRHFKGGMYYVEGVGQHTETGEKLVSYRDGDGELMFRPLSGLKGWLTEEINRKMPDGSKYTGPRFTFVGKVVKNE